MGCRVEETVSEDIGTAMLNLLGGIATFAPIALRNKFAANVTADMLRDFPPQRDRQEINPLNVSLPEIRHSLYCLPDATIAPDSFFGPA